MMNGMYPALCEHLNQGSPILVLAGDSHTYNQWRRLNHLTRKQAIHLSHLHDALEYRHITAYVEIATGIYKHPHLLDVRRVLDTSNIRLLAILDADIKLELTPHSRLHLPHLPHGIGAAVHRYGGEDAFGGVGSSIHGLIESGYVSEQR